MFPDHVENGFDNLFVKIVSKVEKCFAQNLKEPLGSVFQKKISSPKCRSDHLKNSFVNFEKNCKKSEKFSNKVKKWIKFFSKKCFFIEVFFRTRRFQFWQLCEFSLPKAFRSNLKQIEEEFFKKYFSINLFVSTLKKQFCQLCGKIVLRLKKILKFWNKTIFRNLFLFST